MTIKPSTPAIFVTLLMLICAVTWLHAEHITAREVQEALNGIPEMPDSQAETDRAYEFQRDQFPVIQVETGLNVDPWSMLFRATGDYVPALRIKPDVPPMGNFSEKDVERIESAEIGEAIGITHGCPDPMACTYFKMSDTEVAKGDCGIILTLNCAPTTTIDMPLYRFK